MRAVVPVIIGLSIRLALAPFFMHAWDMTTITLATNQFLSAMNPYTYFAQQSTQLAQTSGLPLPYYGFAYLATTLVIYAPFYALYTALGFAPIPLIGWQGQPGQTLGLVYPDAFYMLFLLKLPVIAADTIAIYLLYRKNGRAGWTYALSPYVIVITCLWGNFDPLVGVLLFVSYLAFDKSKLGSGFAFGLSMMKIYTIVAAPAFLISIGRKPRELLAFLGGAVVANAPSIYYIYSNPSSFLSVFVFQASRPTSGLNIYHSLLAVRSISWELSLAPIISGIFAVAAGIAVFMVWRFKLELKESIILLLLVYLVFAPVANEQLLAALVPLGLISRNFSHKLTIFPLVFIAFNGLYLYFATPIFFGSSSLLATFVAVNGWWTSIIGPYATQAQYAIGAAMGVACLLLARSTFEGPFKIRWSLTRLEPAPKAPLRGR
ncbi:MAG: hypothetical protein OK452_10010 [Thaumarchaeota archaeon]|nr:hypothetical protein [Nitrososphaerota archaeon]